MKKLILLSFLTLSSVSFLYMMNCSKPLDSINDFGQTNSDTVFVGDTIIVADTMFCARLNAQRQEIVWIIQNQDGFYYLDFVAITERIDDTRTLIIEINDQVYFWPLEETHELTIERTLDDNTIIRIESDPPHAYGNAIDICLSLREP